MRRRNYYDTTVVQLFALEKEYILPEDFRRSIPPSTISCWRNQSREPVGSEFRDLGHKVWDREIILRERRRLEQLLNAITRVWLTLEPIMKPVFNDKAHRERVIDAIQQLTRVIPNRMALKLFGISYSAFNYRLNQLMYQCELSAIKLCKRRHPCQLTPQEVTIMKALACDRRFICWPITSLANNI